MGFKVPNYLKSEWMKGSELSGPIVVTILETGEVTFERDGRSETKPYLLFDNGQKRSLGPVLVAELVQVLGMVEDADAYVGQRLTVTPKKSPNGWHTVSFSAAPDAAGPTVHGEEGPPPGGRRHPVLGALL